MRKTIRSFVITYRLPLIICSHICFIIFANYLAFLLRFDGDIPAHYIEPMVSMFLWLVVARALTYLFFGLYKGLWRYTGIWDLWRIVSATVLSSIGFYIIVRFFYQMIEYPRSIFIIDTVFLIFFMGGIRLPWRIYRELNRHKKGKRVLIYGAGDAGEMIIRDMRQHPEYKYDPVGFIDDDFSKVGQTIHGVPVIGTSASLSAAVSQRKIEEIILAIPSADPLIRRKILSNLESFHVPIKTTPNMIDIIEGKVTVGQIRNLAIEDLLARVPVDLNLEPVNLMLHDKRILVTGAAGSIGSELCRQIAAMEPEMLILFERYENGLYEITHELHEKGYDGILQPLIGDITDKEHVERIFETYKPEIVFHAAAHKHVPLMEENPCEAIKNNVAGTRILCNAAMRNRVEKFVLISSDKAVNPSSVMGASKRIGEMMIHAMAHRSVTSFVSVRFGNVLASNGSVVPLFLSQIKRGGPVTVTHPEMQRYFMLIPEAVRLVLLAASIGGDAETYVLRMGDQIKVLDMAKNLIRLSGLIPEVDIPIKFTGLRAGEKLYEELVGEDEISEDSGVDEIIKIRPLNSIDAKYLRSMIRKLEELAKKGRREELYACLKELMPSFQQNAAAVEPRVEPQSRKSPASVSLANKEAALEHKTA